MNFSSPWDYYLRHNKNQHTHQSHTRKQEMNKLKIDPNSVASLSGRRFNNVLDRIVTQGSVSSSACRQIQTVASHIKRNDQNKHSFDVDNNKHRINKVLSLPRLARAPQDDEIQPVPSSSSSSRIQQTPTPSTMRQSGSTRIQTSNRDRHSGHVKVTTSGERILTLLQDQKVHKEKHYMFTLFTTIIAMIAMMILCC